MVGASEPSIYYACTSRIDSLISNKLFPRSGKNHRLPSTMTQHQSKPPHASSSKLLDGLPWFWQHPFQIVYCTSWVANVQCRCPSRLDTNRTYLSLFHVQRFQNHCTWRWSGALWMVTQFKNLRLEVPPLQENLEEENIGASKFS